MLSQGGDGNISHIQVEKGTVSLGGFYFALMMLFFHHIGLECLFFLFLNIEKGVALPGWLSG